MAKVKEVTWSDWFFRWGMMLSALLLIVACCPMVHMHYAFITGYGQAYGQRFVVDRRFGMFGATNHLTQWTSWFKYKTLVCRRAEEYLRPNALQVTVNIAAQVFASQGDKLLGLIPGLPEGAKHAAPGGAIMGCDIWDLCKNHALDRCYQYTTLAYSGFASFAFVIIGSITAIVSTILMIKDGNVKKKKKKERAEQNTCCAATIAFLTSFMGFGGWQGAFYMTMVKLNHTSWYPMPTPSVGIIIGSIALVFQLIAVILSYTRQGGVEEKKDWEGGQYACDGYGQYGYDQYGGQQAGYGYGGQHAQIPTVQAYAVS